MNYQIFDSPQVKRSVMISKKDGICKLPHELPNNLRFKKFGNLKKAQNFIELKASAQPYYQNENFIDTSENL